MKQDGVPPTALSGSNEAMHEINSSIVTPARREDPVLFGAFETVSCQRRTSSQNPDDFAKAPFFNGHSKDLTPLLVEPL